MTTSARERYVYGMAPLIRFTLLTLYLALCFPLPWLAPFSLRPWLWLAVVGGGAAMVALTSEQVVLDPEGLQVSHPGWCAWWLRRGWQLAWGEVRGLTPVATSQGGRVFYVRAGGGGDQARSYLLPQRVARFSDFLDRFSALSGVSTETVERISPAWTYQLLAVLSGVLLVSEVTALVLGL